MIINGNLRATSGSFFYGTSRYALSLTCITAMPEPSEDVAAWTRDIERVLAKHSGGHAVSISGFRVDLDGAYFCGNGFEVIYTPKDGE